MTLRRGNFELVCNRCGTVEKLATADFEDAKEEVEELRKTDGWTLVSVQSGSKASYADICPTCSD